MSADDAERIASATRGRNGAAGWSQLLDAGLTPAKIKTRVARGDLVRVFPRVYIAGDPALIPLSMESAALISIGPDAVLHDRSAMVVWGLAARRLQPIEVAVARRVRPRQGVRIHRVKHLDRADVRTRSNLRVTSPARTVVDFAATASLDEVEEAIALGLAQGLVSERELHQVMARLPANHPGARAVRALIQRDGGAVMTRSGGERKLRELLREAGLPQPISNAMVHGFEADLYWPDHGLVVELDSRPFHAKSRTFERDRLKSQILPTKGIEVVRVTGCQMRDEPFAVIARLAQILMLRAA
jgi:very-short-patch-repair endonuclease